MTPTKLKARRKLLEGLRALLELNKQEFARRIGITPPEYSNILAGYRAVPVHAAYRLAIDLYTLPDLIEPRHKKTYVAVREYMMAIRESAEIEDLVT